MPSRFHCDQCDKIIKDSEPRLTFEVLSGDGAFAERDYSTTHPVVCSLICVFSWIENNKRAAAPTLNKGATFTVPDEKPIGRIT